MSIILYTTATINLNPESLLEAINKHEAIFAPTDDSRLALAALPHTQQHEYLIDTVTNDFLLCLANVPNSKWTEALKPVKFKTFGKKVRHPKILVDIGGEKTPTKVMIANKALIDWMASMKKNRLVQNVSGTSRLPKINGFELFSDHATSVTAGH